jgi:peptidoglycan/xylan/chitin deacetylase (PgdA/CDA1 family)
MRRKEVLARFASCTGLFRATQWLRRSADDALLVLGYHRVMRIDDPDNYPFDLELISATPEQFEAQMRLLRERFSPVSVGEIADRLESGRRLPPRAVLVTFDDGFSDNYEYAYPILCKHRIPACIFVSTDLIGADSTFWFDYVAYALMRAPVNSVKLPGARRSLPEAPDPASRRRAIDEVQRKLKNIKDEELRAFIEALEASSHTKVDESVRGLSRPLTWEQIREMAAGGIDFGSHGATHALLSQVPVDRLDYEIRGSKERLEQELGRRVDAISYPVGGPAAFSEDVIESVRTSDYRLGFTYVVGANRLSGLDRFRLQRQHVERPVSIEFFEGLLTWPRVFT